MYRDARGLVECNKSIVLVQDILGKHLWRSGLGFSIISRTRSTNRRNAQHITHDQTASSIDALAVDAHFTATQDAVDMTFRHAFEVLEEEVVDTLGFAAFVNRYPGHRFFA